MNNVAPWPSIVIVLAIGGSAFGPYQKLSGASMLKVIVCPAYVAKSIVLSPAAAPVQVPMPTVVATECDNGAMVVAPGGVASVGLLARLAA